MSMVGGQLKPMATLNSFLKDESQKIFLCMLIHRQGSSGEKTIFNTLFKVQMVLRSILLSNIRALISVKPKRMGSSAVEENKPANKTILLALHCEHL